MVTLAAHKTSCRTSPSCKGQCCLGCNGILRRSRAGAALQTFCWKSCLLHLAAECSACPSLPLSPWPPPHWQVNKINSVATAFGKYVSWSFHSECVLLRLWHPARTDRRGEEKSWLDVKRPLSSFLEHPLKIAAPMCVSLPTSSTTLRSSAQTSLSSSQSKVSLPQTFSVTF